VSIDGPLNLEDFHDIESFTCGSPSVDQWVKDHARRNSKRSIGRVCVYVKSGTNTVVAIYALTIRIVVKEKLNSKFRSCSPEGGIPAYFIGQFAVSVHFQRQGLGSKMLADIFKSLKYQYENIDGFPAPFVYLDAVDEAAAKFWLKNDFKHFPKINKCAYLRATSFLTSYVHPCDSAASEPPSFDS
jgi:ribosomal protein S18 acetylase RimI-like enzyme